MIICFKAPVLVAIDRRTFAMLNATIVNRVDLTKDLIFLQIKPDHGVPEFSPGQYVALGLPDNPASEKVKLLKRAYSIGSPPSEKNHLEFYIAILPEGEFTPKLVAIKPGDRIFVAPKITGTFTLKNAPPDANLVLVSTGTGIAPFMAMLRTNSTWTGREQITIVHGVRYETDLAYADEIQALIEGGRPLKYYCTVSRAGEGWKGCCGYVQQYFTDGTISLNPAKDHVFLCGNPAMIEDVQKVLADKGYTENTRKQPGNLHLEKYW